jgi:hypothetical protein
MSIEMETEMKTETEIEQWIKKEGVEKALIRIITDFYDGQSGKSPWETKAKDILKEPTEGTILHGGWGANQDPKIWNVISMNDKPEFFKVVDNNGINVATDFTTEANAKYYIEYFQSIEDEDDNPPSPHNSSQLDKEGVQMLLPTKIGGKEYYTKDYSYRRSKHGQKSKPELGKIPRDTFTLKNVPFMQAEYTFVGKIDFTSDDDFSFKVGSKNHSGNDPDGEGQCYSFGISSNGKVHLSKETPRHPKTPNFDSKVKVESGMAKSLGNISNKVFGCKGLLQFVDDNTNVLISVYVDIDPIDKNGKANNNWKLWWTAKDDGSWKNKPQTFFAKGNDQTLYHRIDHVGKKTETYFMSAREI